MESADCHRRVPDAEQSAWSYSMAAPRAPVKQEPEWGEGVSPAAEAEDLYAGHEVKDEIVIGPVLLQPQDIVISMQSALSSTEEAPCKLEPAGGAGECTHTRPGEGPRCSNSLQQQYGLRSCSVRLQRLHMEDLQTCKACLMTFDCKSSVDNHSCTHSVEESIVYKEISDETAKIHFKCDICGKQYEQKKHLVRHIATHNVGNPSNKARSVYTGATSFSDNVSKTPFRNRKALITHTGKRPGPHSCGICEKQFLYKSRLTSHIRIHTSEKPFSCDVCKKHFTCKSSLNLHRKIHTGEKLFSCDVCGKQFTHRSSLDRHLLIHTGEKRYNCDTCEKQFAQKDKLITHIRIHTGEKPFSCDVCQKQFTERGNMTKHRRVHTGDKPFSCGVCKKQFTVKSDLTIHSLQAHKGKKRK